MRATATPTVMATATATMKDAESFTGFEAVTKMIADMICGPAIIVTARGSICRFMVSWCHRPAPCIPRREGFFGGFLKNFRGHPSCRQLGEHESLQEVCGSSWGSPPVGIPQLTRLLPLARCPRTLKPSTMSAIPKISA